MSQELMFRRLDRHQIIAWDFDGTLVDGPFSHIWRAYLLSTPEKQHHIVTFRTGPSRAGLDGTWAEDALHELEDHGIKRTRILAVHSIPQEIFQHYGVARLWSEDSGLAPEIVANAERMIEWKGKCAKSFGATVLVDDMEDMVRLGCDRHGVEFVHSHYPLGDFPAVRKKGLLGVQ